MQKELELFQRLAETLLAAEQQNPVVPPVDANRLFEELDLSLHTAPAVDADFEKSLRDLILATPRTATRLFFNQLFGGRQPRATLGDLLAVMLNNSMNTYKVAGPQVGVEKAILHKICDIIGYEKESDGTFAPGGSMSNLMAMLMARDRYNKNIRQQGVQGKLIAYTSAESHYSTLKNASFAGIGREQVRHIPTDDHGRMLPNALKDSIQKDIAGGHSPFFVNATAGTTVLGSFDPVLELGTLSRKHNLWLHVDGAYCGAVIFSKKFKHLVAGLEHTDSFCINAHKMLGTPLSSSIIVVQDKKHLYDSFANEADYLYQTDADEYNLGKTSLQCGRRNDALKLWTLWKSVGTQGLEAMVNHQFALAQAARDYIRNHPDYTLYSFDDSVSICFNYKDIAARELCTQLYGNARLMVGYGSFRENEFVRLVTINATNQKEDILNFFKEVEAFVAKMEEAKV